MKSRIVFIICVGMCIFFHIIISVDGVKVDMNLRLFQLFGNLGETNCIIPHFALFKMPPYTNAKASRKMVGREMTDFGLKEHASQI